MEFYKDQITGKWHFVAYEMHIPNFCGELVLDEYELNLCAQYDQLAVMVKQAKVNPTLLDLDDWRAKLKAFREKIGPQKFAQVKRERDILNKILNAITIARLKGKKE